MCVRWHQQTSIKDAKTSRTRTRTLRSLKRGLLNDVGNTRTRHACVRPTALGVRLGIAQFRSETPRNIRHVLCGARFCSTQTHSPPPPPLTNPLYNTQPCSCTTPEAATPTASGRTCRMCRTEGRTPLAQAHTQTRTSLCRALSHNVPQGCRAAAVSYHHLGGRPGLLVTAGSQGPCKPPRRPAIPPSPRRAAPQRAGLRQPHVRPRETAVRTVQTRGYRTQPRT
jgi:hypothetical protein